MSVIAIANYLKIYRPINIVLLLLGQFFAAYYLWFDADLSILIFNNFHFYLIGSASVAAFGYWINDYYDISRDKINKPNKVGLGIFPFSLIFIHFLVFFVIALWSGFSISADFGIFFGVTFFLLWLYSFHLKDYPLIGNFIIGLLSFSSLYALKWIFPNIEHLLLIHFSVLAGLVNMAREMVKDAEDIEGDKASGSNTYPIEFGIDANNKMVNLLLLFGFSFLIISLFYQLAYFRPSLKWLYIGYNLLFIFTPMYKVIAALPKANTASDFHTISMLLKYVMFAGILSILFF